jgi:hypothetical protein
MSTQNLSPSLTTISGSYGTAYLTNCLKFMKTLPDRAFDLVFTDTIWGHDYQKNAQKPMGINQQATKQNRVPYMDKWVPSFHQTWFREAQRISNAQVVCVGRKHKNWWISEFRPLDWVTLYYKNGQGSTAISNYSAKMDYYCFGDPLWWKKHKFHRDVYETYIHNGFLRDSEDTYNNPSPKDTATWFAMLADLRPSSVYDPFLGSGTIGEVGERLKLAWAGTEMNLNHLGQPAGYDADIRYRIDRGMAWIAPPTPLPKPKYKQHTLSALMRVSVP